MLQARVQIVMLLKGLWNHGYHTSSGVLVSRSSRAPPSSRDKKVEGGLIFIVNMRDRLKASER